MPPKSSNSGPTRPPAGVHGYSAPTHTHTQTHTHTHTHTHSHARAQSYRRTYTCPKYPSQTLLPAHAVLGLCGGEWDGDSLQCSNSFKLQQLVQGFRHDSRHVIPLLPYYKPSRHASHLPHGLQSELFAGKGSYKSEWSANPLHSCNCSLPKVAVPVSSC